MLDGLKWRLVAKLFGGDRASRIIGVKVGHSCRICPCGFGSEPWLVSIGDRVTVAPGVSFVTHDGSSWLFRDEWGRRYRYSRIAVGNDVFLGVNAIIMPGVRIGSRVIVGAGSVVTWSVPDGVIVAGCPARIVGRYDELERRALETFPTGADMRGRTWRERIESVVEQRFRPELTDETPAAK